MYFRLNNSPKLFSGRCLIIDPSYIFTDNKTWTSVCKLLKHQQQQVLVDNLHTLFISDTSSGDGVYPVIVNGATVGSCGVDSGLLSLIPEEVYTYLLTQGGAGAESQGVWVNIPSPTEVSVGYDLSWTIGPVITNTELTDDFST